MAQGWESIESQIFRQHSSSFADAITEVTPLANKLHEKSLIDRYTHNKVTERASGLSEHDKATEVVKVLQKAVSVLTNDKKRQEKFEQIMSIFSEFCPLGDVAEEAKEAYHESSKRERRKPPKEVVPPHDHAANAATPKPFLEEVRMAKASTSRDYLGILLLGRTGMGKSTTGNKLLEAGGNSVLRDYKITEFDAGSGPERYTREVRSVFRPGTERVKAVQVIDTPGFADSDTNEGLGVYRANLALFCDLIRRRINDKLRIHRVLYFLPSRGALERADAVLQEEIRLMHYFFGNAIFDQMVLVATLHRRYTKFGFSPEDIEETRKVFEQALMFALRDGCPKCPPVLYIGFGDKGVDIQQRIESAYVVSNKVLTLDKLVQGTCSWCCAKYLCHEDDDPHDPDKQLGVLIHIKGEGQKCSEEKFIPYHSSHCHPMFIPKYSYAKRMVGGVAHLATLGIPMVIRKLKYGEHPWPTFTSSDEMCAYCQQSPGSDGCMKLGTRYRTTLPTGETMVITVDHKIRSEDYFSKYLDVI